MSLSRPAATSHVARLPHLRWVLVGLGLAVPGVLFAEAGWPDEVSRAPDGRILHRRTRDPNETGVAEAPIFVYDPGSKDAIPKDLVRDGRPLERPSTSAEPSDGEPVHTALGLSPAKPSDADGAAGPRPLPAPGPGTVDDPSAPFPAGAPEAADARDPSNDLSASASPGDPPEGDGASPEGRSLGDTPPDPRSGLGSEASPDRRTQREGTLHYSEVFDPSVVPFKRNRALDTVGEDLVLRVNPSRFETLEPVGNTVVRGREVFWGSLLVEGEAGQRIPIPSVSPEGQILSYQATPAQAVRFERDEAGNFYATPTLAGRLRLVFVTDAPSHWFGRVLPADASFAGIPRALRPRVPKSVAREAREVAEAIGIEKDLGFIPTLERLVGYFRSFEPGDPPPAKGSAYKDIALGKRGICRHRSHAFVVTAQTLGIPARYVFNEAHVFVEVYVSGTDPGWLRIDLGGGADELQVHGGEGKRLHQPVTPDPFEKPAGFGDPQSAGATRVEGLPDADPRESDPSDAGPGLAEASATGAAGPIVRARAQPGLVPTRTTLGMAGNFLFRGEAVKVSGRVETVDGAPVPTGLVQVLLMPARRADAAPLALLGTAAIQDGRYTVEVAIPARQSPGSYELISEFLGDGTFAASVGN